VSWPSHISAKLLADPIRDEHLLLASCLVCRTQGAWTISNFVEHHRHHPEEPPRPLTAAEREQVRIRGIHRRGALRASYGRTT
jgi:hypothetical protein